MSVAPISEVIVGSRVVEIEYVSPPNGEPLGNNIAVGQQQIALSGCSRVIEIDYTSR